MNWSNLTESLINTLTTFPVFAPSQNPYKSREFSSEAPQITFPKSQKTSTFPKTVFVGKLFLQKSTSYGTSGRSAKWKMLIRWSSFFHTFCNNLISTIKKPTSTRCFDLNPSLSWKNTFSFGAIWDLFLEEYIAVCDGFDIILKYDPKKRPSK